MQHDDRSAGRPMRAGFPSPKTMQSETEAAPGGRWAKQEGQHIVGRDEPTKIYAAANWSADPVPNEEPFGIDVNAPVVVGETWEVEESIRKLSEPHPNVTADAPGMSAPAAITGPCAIGDAAGAGDGAGSLASPASSLPNPSIRRRKL